MEKQIKIRVSYHAKQRLKERFSEISSLEYESVARLARYKGKMPAQLRDEYPRLAEYLFKRFRKSNITSIRYYREHVFVFKNDMLVTVVDIPHIERFLY